MVSSMVDLTFVQDINEITRAKDQKSWSFSKKSSLQELRSLKALVRDKAQIKLHLAEDS